MYNNDKVISYFKLSLSRLLTQHFMIIILHQRCSCE